MYIVCVDLMLRSYSFSNDMIRSQYVYHRTHLSGDKEGKQLLGGIIVYPRTQPDENIYLRFF